jgi:hypothetical protein
MSASRQQVFAIVQDQQHAFGSEPRGDAGDQIDIWTLIDAE